MHYMSRLISSSLSHRVDLPRQRRAGFTMIELLVVLAVIALLCALLLPAVQVARESARRTQCQSNLKQLGLALHNFEAAKGHFPSLAFVAELLPFLDQKAVADLLLIAGNTDTRVYAIQIPTYGCPSDPAPANGVMSYSGNYTTGYQVYGSNGFFDWSMRPLTSADIVDGLSNTAAISEILHDDGTEHRMRVAWRTPRLMALPTEFDAFATWCESIPPNPLDYGYRHDGGLGSPWHFIAPYNHILPPNRPLCSNFGNNTISCYPPASYHPHGVNVLFGDGHVEFVSESIDRAVWREMGSRTARVEIP